MKNDLYKETLEILIATLAILAFIVSTSEYVIFKEEVDNNELEQVEYIKKNFYDLYVTVTIMFIFIFFLFFINKNYLQEKIWIILLTKRIIIFNSFMLFLIYVQVIFKKGWIGKLLHPILYNGGSFSLPNISLYLLLIPLVTLIFIIPIIRLYNFINNLL